jgi:hypothetical protein
MNQPLADAAREIDALLRQQGWEYCIVGGVAIGRWGEPRATKDVDLCLLTSLGDEDKFIGKILETFPARIANAAEFAKANRVLLITASNNVGIDVALGWTSFEQGMVKRASKFNLAPGLQIPTASKEDLVVTKAFAGRPQDWVDVEGILERQRGKLDWDHIRQELNQLCELTESPENLEQLERLREKVESK